MKKKHIVVIICGVIVLFLVGLVVTQTMFMFKNNKDATKVEYRMERKPIEDRFPELPNFTECYWKANTIGYANFGPTSYWMRGFLCLDEKALQKILADYDWNADTVIFPKGIDPAITGKSGFSWYSNKNFQLVILRQRFVGSIYLDTANGVLYFDVENN